MVIDYDTIKDMLRESWKQIVKKSLGNTTVLPGGKGVMLTVHLPKAVFSKEQHHNIR